MAILSGAITVCIFTVGIAPVKCTREPFKAFHNFGSAVCEDLLEIEIIRTREKIEKELKPGEMASIRGECFPIEWDEKLDKT